ncbi:MAG: acyl--CoA ligase [Ruminiclostridium sp.]|nr:acyl--CoA ligase [Ruminiclostridium sp.]
MSHAMFRELWRGKETQLDRPAIRCGEHVLTFGAFFDLILRAEAGLRALGVRPGELVTILSMNTPETIAAFYAIDRIGAVANWVDMKLSPAEVEGYLTRADARVVLVLEAAFRKVYENRGRSPACHFICLPLAPYVSPRLGGKLRLGNWVSFRGAECLSWEEFLRESGGETPEVDRWEEPAVITYTGGTTGPAKGVMLSRRAFYASLVQYTKSGTEHGSGANLVLLPPFAAFGLCQCIHVPLCLGMEVILVPMFRPDQLGELLLRYRPEQVSGTTSYWQMLLNSSAVEDADLSFLKNPRSGGDAMSAELERRINEFLAARGCSAKLVQEYGMSEVCGIVCLSYGPRRTEGTVGKPLPGCRIIAADPSTGEELPPGRQGELLICSDTVMNGYYGMPEADSQVLKPAPDGTRWIWSKDVGYLETDGSVVVTGRKKRMISRNGFKIFPNVIEDCLLRSPRVEACAVVGGQSPDGETLPVAHIVAKAGEDPEEVEKELRELAGQMLNSYLVPAAWYFRPDLPLTERGKLDYRTLELETHLK